MIKSLAALNLSAPPNVNNNRTRFFQKKCESRRHYRACNSCGIIWILLGSQKESPQGSHQPVGGQTEDAVSDGGTSGQTNAQAGAPTDAQAHVGVDVRTDRRTVAHCGIADALQCSQTFNGTVTGFNLFLHFAKYLIM